MRSTKLLRKNRRADQAEADHVEPFFEMPVPGSMLPLMLVAKLHEEAEEIRSSMDAPEEYADLLQVLYDLASFNGITRETIETARLKKLGACGNFIDQPHVLYRD